MYLDCFYQYVVIPLVTAPEQVSTSNECDETGSALPAAAAGSLSKALENGFIKGQPEAVDAGEKLASREGREIAAAAGPCISSNNCGRIESPSSTLALLTHDDVGNKVSKTGSPNAKSGLAEPLGQFLLNGNITSTIEVKGNSKSHELWVGEKEVRLRDGEYKWVCWKDAAGVIRTRMGSGGSENLKRYRLQRWPRRVQRWIAFSFNRRSGHKPWERIRFTDILSESEPSLDLDIQEKSELFISEIEIAEKPARTKVFWGATINRDCSLLRVETIEALKMYCRHDHHGFMDMVHRYKTVITNDLCTNINPGPIFTAEMAKDAKQHLAATSWAGVVPLETMQYVRDIIHLPALS